MYKGPDNVTYINSTTDISHDIEMLRGIMKKLSASEIKKLLTAYESEIILHNNVSFEEYFTFISLFNEFID